MMPKAENKVDNKKEIGMVLKEAAKILKIERADFVKNEDMTKFFKIAYADEFNAAKYQNEKKVLARWEWANIKNPDIQNNGFPAWFCKDRKNNEICGHLGVIPVSIMVNNRDYRAVWGRDMIVPRKWRRSGICSFLFDTVMTETKQTAELFLLAGLNDYAVSIYKKLGFIHIGYVPLYVRIIKLDGILRKHIRNSYALNLLKSIGRTALAIFYLPSKFRMRAQNKNINIRQIPYFDDSFNVLWRMASPSFLIITKRNSSHLNWRFVNQPFWDYKIFIAEKDGELAGYIVLRDGKSQGLRVGVISDLFAHQDDNITLDSLISFAVTYFEKEGKADLIRCDILNRKFEYALKKFGFLKAHSNSHFMVGNISDKIDRELIAKYDNWFISYADCDLDLSEKIGDGP